MNTWAEAQYYDPEGKYPSLPPEHLDDDLPVVDISEGIIRTSEGTWTAKGLAERLQQLEAQLNAVLARMEAK